MNSTILNDREGFLLRYAAASGDNATIQRLIAEGARIDVLDNAPIRWAASHGHADSVQLLLKLGASIDGYEEELFSIALKLEAPKLLELLLKAAQRPLSQSLLDHSLEQAVTTGNRETVELLLKAGADPNGRENNIYPMAAAKGDLPTMGLLERFGADPFARECQAFVSAALNGQVQAIRHLRGALLKDHWYFKGWVPCAVTLKPPAAPGVVTQFTG